MTNIPKVKIKIKNKVVRLLAIALVVLLCGSIVTTSSTSSTVLCYVSCLEVETEVRTGSYYRDDGFRTGHALYDDKKYTVHTDLHTVIVEDVDEDNDGTSFLQPKDKKVKFADQQNRQGSSPRAKRNGSKNGDGVDKSGDGDNDGDDDDNKPGRTPSGKTHGTKDHHHEKFFAAPANELTKAMQWTFNIYRGSLQRRKIEITVLIVYMATMALLILLFALRRIPIIKGLYNHACATGHRPTIEKKQWDSWFGWIKPVLYMPDKEILEFCNDDSLLMIKFMREFTLWFFVIMLVNCSLLIPLRFEKNLIWDKIFKN